MTARNSALAPRSSSPLDIRPRQLSIRSLEGRRPAAPPRDPTDRVRGEFNEMRGFSPTLQQAAKLFDLPTDVCDRVLGSLVEDGSLRRCEDGRYRLP
jgi:hypothetical protein